MKNYDSIGELIYKIIDFSIFLFGYIFSIPFIFTSRLIEFPAIKSNDKFDIWTFAHSYATLLIAFILYTFNISVLWSSIISFAIMYLYELLIDGNRLEDPEGFSISDIGANSLSVIVFLILYYLLHAIL